MLPERGIPYHLIDSGQHAKTAADLRGFLGVKEPDATLQDEGNIKTIWQTFGWLARKLQVTPFGPVCFIKRKSCPARSHF